MSISLARRHARAAAVRIGTRNHAGFLSHLTGADSEALYGASCGAGRSRTTGDITPRAANGDPIDCCNCVRHHADTVAKIHAAQDAATGVAPMVDADQANEQAPTLTAPRPGLLIRALSAYDMWCAILAGANANTIDPAQRRRAAWIVEALRHIYGLSMSATYAEIDAARAADTRDDDTRAREYLAAYAGQIDDRAETLDKRACAYRTSDMAQRIAGVRPPVGAWVSVDGHAGRWEVIERIPAEESRFPFAIRVQQEGHTFNGSVPLTAVTVITADVDATGNPAGWIPVATADTRDGDTVAGEREEWLSDVVTGCATAMTYRDRDGNVWVARGMGSLTSATRPTRGAALTALSLLDTMTAGQLAGRPGGVGPVGANGWRLILPDGTPATVRRAWVYTGTERAAYGPDQSTAGGYGYPAGTVIAGPSVRLAVHLDTDPAARLSMRAPGADGYGAAADGFAVLVVPLHARVALAPECGKCTAGPGEPCMPWCDSL